MAIAGILEYNFLLFSNLTKVITTFTLMLFEYQFLSQALNITSAGLPAMAMRQARLWL
jgi:hypothetical protein